MKIEYCKVVGVKTVAADTFVLTFVSSHIAQTTLPGQFVNVRFWTGSDPLLRRPFSVYRIEGDQVSIVFNKVGRGTAMLSEATPGEIIDILGPLGTPFTYDKGEFSTAVLVGGGLGVAPLPMLGDAMKKAKISYVTLLGARTKTQLVPQHLEHLSTATDDGSDGYHGTVVQLARCVLGGTAMNKAKLFGCGPTPMLRALTELASHLGIPCEISLEGPMGCGFGICQGCPVRLRNGSKEYALMCREGPVFSADLVHI